MVNRISYKKNCYKIDVVNIDGKITVYVDGTERPVYVRTQGTTGNPSYVVYVPNAGHNKQLTISRSIIEAVKEGINSGN